jgi:hypothetical protein
MTTSARGRSVTGLRKRPPWNSGSPVLAVARAAEVARSWPEDRGDDP